jgi:Tfp pilus assembly protein PilO
MAWQFERRVTIGNLLSIAATLAAVTAFYMKTQAHIEDKNVHHTDRDLRDTYVLRSEQDYRLQRIESDVRYIRDRLDGRIGRDQ